MAGKISELAAAAALSGAELVEVSQDDGGLGSRQTTAQAIADLHDGLVAADIDTLAELNAIVSDATLDDTTGTRTPTDDSVTVAKLNGTVVGDADDLVALDGAGGFKGIDSGAYVAPGDIAPLPTGGATGDLFIVRQTASGFEYVEITEDPA